MDQENLLKEIILDFYSRIAFLNGSLLQLYSNIKDYSKIFVESWNQQGTEKPKYTLLSRLIVSDLTGPTDNGWKIHYPTTGDYIVSFDDFEKKTSALVNQYSHFIIIQSYEIFEIFIRDMIAGFFIIKPDIGAREILKSKGSENPFLKIVNLFRFLFTKKQDLNRNWYAEVHRIRPGKNNKFLFKILRTISKDNLDFELRNNENINLRNWYFQFSIVRHSIIHSECFIPESTVKNMNDLQLFEKFFPATKENAFYKINLDRNHAELILEMLSDYAFQIFKSLSITLGKEWKILPNMKSK